jgi:spheroidene monooxygenase
MKDIQCASMTFFKFDGILNQIWGMTLLLSLKFNFSKYDQFEFFKLLGAGSGLGYRAWPKFGVIGVFMIWKSAEGAKEFFESKTFKRIQETCKEQFTVLMQPTSSKRNLVRLWKLENFR